MTPQCCIYLSDLITTTAKIRSRICLRSASTHRYEPLTTRLKFGKRCCSHAWPKAWNSMPHFRAKTENVFLSEHTFSALWQFLPAGHFRCNRWTAWIELNWTECRLLSVVTTWEYALQWGCAAGAQATHRKTFIINTAGHDETQFLDLTYRIAVRSVTTRPVQTADWHIPSRTRRPANSGRCTTCILCYAASRRRQSLAFHTASAANQQHRQITLQNMATNKKNKVFPKPCG